MIIKKNEEEIENIKKACRIAASVLLKAGKEVRPGMKTRELDTFIENELVNSGAKPAFKGYRGYRHASCLSVNNEVVHGIPGDRELCEGDIVGIDVGAIYNGCYGDTAKTFPVGKVGKSAKNLIRTAQECLEKGIEAVKNGKRIGDISNAIESHASRKGYSVVRDLFGHGVGRQLHEDPLIPNFGKPGQGPKIEPGMTFAIEPMLNTGQSSIVTLDDGWTVVTSDGGLSAHFEHTVLVSSDSVEVLTRI